MSKKIFLLIFCFVGSVVFIAGLQLASVHDTKNKFIRLFPPHLVQPIKVLDLTYNSFYFAGLDSNSIYFANATAPAILLKSNFQLVSVQEIKLNNQTNSDLIQGINTVKINYDSVYMLFGRTNTLMTGNIKTKAIRTAKASIPFDLSVYSGNSEFIVRSLDNKFHQDVLFKLTSKDPMQPIDTFVLDKNGDGIFSADGKLIMDPKTKSVFYVYYHCNEIVKLNENLQLVYKGHTIDTTSHVNIKTATIESKGITTLVSPSVINKFSAVNTKWLFVNSTLRADNELKRSFSDNAVIDVYSANTGEYQFSFYLPNYNSSDLSNFYVFNNTLLAFYKQYVFLYHLNF